MLIPEQESEAGYVFSGKLVPNTFIICAPGNRVLLTFHPDGRIELGEGAEPTEAAAACFEHLQGFFTQALAAHRIAGEQAIVAWLRSETETSDCVYWSGAAIDIADSIERGEHLPAIRALKGPQA